MGEEGERDVRKEEEEEEAEKEIYKYIFGFVEMGVVKCAIQLNIPDTIPERTPMSLSQLASTLNCDPSMLYRIMRFLTHRNIFKVMKHDDDDDSNNNKMMTCYYGHTPLSRLLKKSRMAPFVLLESSPVMLAPWHNLSGRVLANGTSSFEKAHGDDVWSYAARDAAHSDLINDAMACDARTAVKAMMSSSECREVFDKLTTIVDVGGGNGTAMRELSRACPSLTSLVNFDLPHVIHHNLISHHNDDNKVQHVAGDMFLSVPKAQAVLLMWVLHDWGDHECVHILKNCRQAILDHHNKGRVLIAEAVLQDHHHQQQGHKKKNDVALMLDMVMMAHTNIGKERTLSQWDSLLKQAGFSSFTPIHLNSVKSLLLCTP